METIRAGSQAVEAVDTTPRKLTERERCLAVAAKYTPADVTVVYWEKSSGAANLDKRILKSPQPVDRESLYVYLHECAHLILDHVRRKAPYMREMEAEKWAQRTLRAENIRVPRRMVRGGWRIVLALMCKAQRRGVKHFSKEALVYTRNDINMRIQRRVRAKMREWKRNENRELQ